MAKKNITIDDLAVMMKNSFDGQNELLNKRFDKIDERFNKADKRIDNVEKTLTSIKRDTANIVHQEEFDKLEGRVGILEGTCVLKKA